MLNSTTRIAQRAMQQSAAQKAAGSDPGAPSSWDTIEARAAVRAVGLDVAPKTAPEPYALTDLGNAERFRDQNAGAALYSYALQAWFAWDGKRWKRDADGAVDRMAHATVRAIADEAKRETGDRAEDLRSWARRSESAGKIRALIDRARCLVEVRPDELDADPWALNCANGTIDLQTGAVHVHDPGDRITRLCPVEYHAGATCDVWTHFLERILPDAEVRDYLQRAVGASIVGLPPDRTIFFPVGPQATGKSTFFGAVQAVLGDYAATADPDAFLRRQTAGGPREDLTALVGARFVATVEVDEGRRLAEGLVKQLTGGDRIRSRSLYARSFEWTSSFHVWIAANDRPRIRHEDGALWDRVRQIPFDVVIPESERDPQLRRDLADPEIGGPAVLAWAVAGALAWRRAGQRLVAPQAAVEATQDYREEMDELADFFDEAVEVREGAETSSADLWAAYVRWADGLKLPPVARLTRRTFGARLRGRDLEPGRDRRNRSWKGVALRPGL